MERIDVYLSPSVQEFNVGVGAYGTEEQRMNMIADIMEYELDRHGLRVARNSPEQTLQQIVAESNALNPRLHAAIHSNATAEGLGQTRGAEIYIHRFGGERERYARSVYNYLSALTPTEDLGIKESGPLFGGQGFYELRYTRAPAFLAEVAFHDNPEDAQFIIDNIYEIGNAMSRGIIEAFGIPYREDSPENIAYLRARYNSIPL